MAAALHTRDPRHMSVIGMAFVVVGCLSLGFAPNWGAALAGVLITGLGDGLLVAGTHMVVARASADVPRAINRLNFYFAVGAIAGPLWAGGMFALNAEARALVFPAMALLAVPVGALLAFTPSPPPPSASDPSEAHHPAGAIAWFMGLVLFLYVGAEFGLGSWVASYSEQEFEAGIFTGALVTSGYWGALMVGRFISGRLFAAGWRPRTVLLTALAAGMVTSAGVSLANEFFAVAVACAFATGLCFGPIWPAAISIVSERSGGGAPAAMVTVGNAGGVFFPFAQGRLIVESGATTGIALTAVLCLVALVVARSAPRVSQS
jgi:fucose permease